MAIPAAQMRSTTELNPLLDRLRDLQCGFRKQPMPTVLERTEWLAKLKQVLLDAQDQLVTALNEDFGNRATPETMLGEIMPSIQGINYAMKRIKRWMKPSKRHVGLQLQPAKAKVIYQPLGVVGIIVPWNYPIYLAMGPLTTALAAGNRAYLKLSEYTPKTSALLAELLTNNFPDDLVAVATGDAQVGINFSKLPFDHLLFTGSTQVGHAVMAAAAENLTPVTLELGGKSPVIIDKDFPIAEAAERICFGKAFNAGQTCVAPDYILLPKSQENNFINAFKACFNKMYSSNQQHYSCIINERQYQRLQDWLVDATQQGATIHKMESVAEDAEQGCMTMHLVANTKPGMKIRQQEVFGPILPIVGYENLDEAIGLVNSGPRPLALYYFGLDENQQEKVLTHTHSGGVCINDTMMHVAVDDLPFGGVGHSGMGQYHGHEGFLTFSKAKPVFSKGKFNGAKLVYPPYKQPILKLLYRFFVR
ncbi:coniferyl aldehyde dehydrogenase [Endozoicomonas sp. SM1973]|uniref:Aldehyde dehydrogenase n=1 Tax=Spartinivicinus marinus TaxID=2994442 RepID=A0A853ID30_9GAMM|nr:coniferyl aldehyde dehydrogenase [Spartinivicinus marinus]MCX4027276.1 coniferyl aldehyde dehydrogenase [Spartinivicinus marinus]NYZ67964.1 coniferyl aldehyde dehydrogenase [Spartinivicinus marinus]